VGGGIKKCDGLKHSGDEADARQLAHLLRLGILPTGTILPPEHRAVRDLARKRMQRQTQCRGECGSGIGLTYLHFESLNFKLHRKEKRREGEGDISSALRQDYYDAQLLLRGANRTVNLSPCCLLLTDYFF
jgi:hypothetical protein